MVTWDELFRRGDFAAREPTWSVRGFAALLAERGAKRVLDLGCGAGRHVVFLAREGFEVHGLDSSAKALLARIKAGLAPGGVAYVAAFTTDDPGYRRCRERGLPEVEPNTFFSLKINSHFFYLAKGELRELFKDFELTSHVEGYSLDLAHGEPHYHGRASVLARKGR